MVCTRIPGGVDEEEFSPKLRELRSDFLDFVQEIKLPLSRASRRVKSGYEAFKRREVTIFHLLHEDFSSRIFAIFIDLPASKPLLYIFYYSTQKWYLTPSKVLPKVRKILKYRRKYSGVQTDAYVAIVAKRYTSGAETLSKQLGVPVRRPDQAREDLKKGFTSRYVGLINKLRGKRVFGELAFLMYWLQEALKELGARVRGAIQDDIHVIRVAEEGMEIPVSFEPVGPP